MNTMTVSALCYV